MTIHLVPVGNSIRDNLATMLRYQPELVRSTGDQLRLRDAELLHLDPMDRTSIQDFLSQVGRDQRLRNVAEQAWDRLGAFGGDGRSGWKTVISAEATSLKAERRQLTVKPDELIVLLTSDSSDGLLSAFWNAVHVAGCPDPLDRIDTSGSVVGRGGVVIKPIANLNLRNRYRVEAAMIGLLETIDAVLDNIRPGEEIVIHLSGDRVVIPFLLREAARMASLREDTTVRAVVVHEACDGSESPISVPLGHAGK